MIKRFQVNKIMRLYESIANLVSASFLVLILVGTYQGSKESHKKFKNFRLCVWFIIAGLVVDSFSFFICDKIPNDTIVTIISFLSYALIEPVIICFSYYIYTLIEEEEPTFNKRFPLYILGLCFIDFVFLIIGTATGNIFSINNGVISYGFWRHFTIVIPGICLLSIFVILMFRIKTWGIKKVIVFTTYLVLPIIAIIMNICNPEIEETYGAFALAITLIYVIIQAKNINETEVRAKLFDVLSKKDVLTGLKNRRGYDEVVANLEDEEDIGIVFCDLNCLKRINDTYGHEAGDKLITDLTKILIDCFRNDDICRISGDEFVVIIHDVDKNSFKGRVKLFSTRIKKDNSIAAFGQSCGKGKDILSLVKEAEKMMYNDKEAYYKSKHQVHRV